MKRSLSTAFFTLIISFSALSQQWNFMNNIFKYIEDPGMFSLNQEPGHVPLVPFSNIDQALKNDWNQSPGYLSLNGVWKFKWSEIPDLAPKDFFNEKFKDQSWDNIKVPGNWEMQGFGDPMFRNVSQPFPSNPPFIPHDYNPTGCYRRTFTVPDTWKDKQVFLRLEAITSASFIWINGQELGFNEGANEPAEYNITRFLKKGDNTLAVLVTKYSAGTYLEDQDFWRLSGIFRDAYLLAVPEVHLRDYFVTTDLDNNYRDAKLNITADIKNYTAKTTGNYSVRASLFDKNHQQIGSAFSSEKVILKDKENHQVQLSAKVDNPGKWSSEHPNLYSLTLELIDPKGNVSEVLSNKIGFKKVEVSHQTLLVNGVPVKLNGTNSHMQHPELGHAMDLETIRKDLVLMKQFNINCVRTSHYPPNIEYLKLADELGVYIVDETGDESHATEFVSKLPEWKNAYIDRVTGMVLRDRNHPAIIFWSAGNESGFGNNICEVIKTGKSLDPTRLFMYGGNSDDVAWKNEVPCEDIIGPRYATPYELRTRIAQVPESQDPRPSFMDEYISVEGNGGGGFDEYWDVIWNYPRISGGAIWDWVSPGIKEKIHLLKDESPNHISVAVKGRGLLEDGKFGKGIGLSGHDQWIDAYRDPSLDITGKELTLSLWVFPRKWNGNGQMITKGSFQFGLNQFTKDSLEFFVTDIEKRILKVSLPKNWENNWHHVAGISDGKNLSIYLDGLLSASKPFSGSITNKPFPVNIGRFSDIEGQEYPYNLSNAIFDRISIFAKAIPVDQLISPSEQMKQQASLWLELNEMEEKGEFYSMGIGGRTYGLIWPDRKPQPELYQVKKSAQPVHVELVNDADGTVEITNRYRFTNLNELITTWQLQADGETLQKGELKLSLAPLSKARVQIPMKKPALQPGVEYRLMLCFNLKEAKPYAVTGYEVAWDQLELPWRASPEPKISLNQEASNSPSVPTHKKTSNLKTSPQKVVAGSNLTPDHKALPPTSRSKMADFDIAQPLSVNETKEIITITGKNFEYAFNKQNGRLTSMKYLGKELIREGAKLSVWRAPLANDLDNWASHAANLNPKKPGMGNFPAGSWYTYGLDQMKIALDKFAVQQQEAGKIVLDIQDHSEGANYTTAFDNHYLYTIYGSGEIIIDHTVTPQGMMPLWLPKIGLQWVIDESLNSVSWYGRGPFETYPDRKTGAKIGVYRKTVQELAESYLVPQDYGCRTDTRWTRLESAEGFGLQFSGHRIEPFAEGIQISGRQLFNFSAQLYSTDNLSRARYPYQLQQLNDGYIFNLDYATSGVGCTAISVLDKYRVLPQEYHFTLSVKPFKK
ncbi:MAG: glycoside hydrolase family 2 TIM barrel-domain containing protein [Prolixibacteraceae bacterium]